MSSCEFELAGSPARLKVAFTILNVRRPILSVGSLLKHGHGVIFARANPYLLLRDESTKSVHRVPKEATRLLSLAAVYPPHWPRW